MFHKKAVVRKGAPKEPKEQKKEKGVRSTPEKKEEKKSAKRTWQEDGLYTTYITILYKPDIFCNY